MKKYIAFVVMLLIVMSCNDAAKKRPEMARPASISAQKTVEQLKGLTDKQRLDASEKACKAALGSSENRQKLFIDTFLTAVTLPTEHSVNTDVVTKLNEWVDLKNIQSDPSATCNKLLISTLKLANNELTLKGMVLESCKSGKQADGKYNFDAFRKQFIEKTGFGIDPTYALYMSSFSISGKNVTPENIASICGDLEKEVASAEKAMQKPECKAGNCK